ncbi:MAG: hypothetical protein P8Y49_05735 [Sulfurovaceae bacterium]
MPNNKLNKNLGNSKNESSKGLPPTKQKPPVPKNVKPPKDSAKS